MQQRIQVLQLLLRYCLFVMDIILCQSLLHCGLRRPLHFWFMLVAHVFHTWWSISPGLSQNCGVCRKINCFSFWSCWMGNPGRLRQPATVHLESTSGPNKASTANLTASSPARFGPRSLGYLFNCV